jgi:hypothetical protein
MTEINFQNDRERELFARAELGESIRKFLLEDSVGQYLHHRAKQQIGQAEIDALTVDPDGWRGWFQARRKLRVIRQRAEVARCFINWLGDALVDGQHAEKELMDDEN